jgi:hypothetical protein
MNNKSKLIFLVILSIIVVFYLALSLVDSTNSKNHITITRIQGESIEVLQTKENYIKFFKAGEPETSYSICDSEGFCAKYDIGYRNSEYNEGAGSLGEMFNYCNYTLISNVTDEDILNRICDHQTEQKLKKENEEKFRLQVESDRQNRTKANTYNYPKCGE